jgi:hypothetical protein
MAQEDQEVQRRDRSSTTAVFDRINKVEGDVAQVREVIAGMNVNLTSQGQTLTRIAMTLDQRGATDWKAIWSAASVLLALIALGATLILSPIRQQIDGNRLGLETLNNRAMIEARSQLQDAREAVRAAEEAGRYKERIDRIDRELEQLHRDSRAHMKGDSDE